MPPEEWGIAVPVDFKIVHVDSQGPADKAGLKIGDKLLNVKDRSIDATRDLGRALDKTTVGTKVPFKIKRGEETSTLTVELGKGI